MTTVTLTKEEKARALSRRTSFSLALSAEERAFLERAAEQTHKTLGEFIRDAAMLTAQHQYERGH